MSPGVSALFQICFAASNNMKEGFWQKTERTVRGLAQVPFFRFFCVARVLFRYLIVKLKIF